MYKSFKKLIKYIFYSALVISLVYLVYFINSNDPLKKIKKRIREILKKQTISKHLLNDYREEFLPNTQFINVDYKKVDLDFRY